MTLASVAIKRAYRTSNLIPLVATPSDNQIAEALPLLNEQILSALGFEAGQELCDLTIGGEFDQSFRCGQWVPENARLVLNLSGATTLKLHPSPYEGQRLAVADAGNNLATHNLILDGNGRTIEGASTLTLSTSGDTRQWIYRADTANWVKITALVIDATPTDDPLPFPQEFDGFFVKRLAMELNPSYGQSLSAETIASLTRIEGKLRARYRRPRPKQELGTLGLMGQRGFTAGESWLYR
jgi:hypothetical protein